MAETSVRITERLEAMDEGRVILAKEARDLRDAPIGKEARHGEISIVPRPKNASLVASAHELVHVDAMAQRHLAHGLKSPIPRR